MSYQQFIEDLGQMFVQLKANLITFIPNLIFAILIILVGIAIARLFQALLNRFIKNIDRFISSRNLQKGLKQIQLEPSGRLVGKIVFWIIVIFFLTVATEALSLPIITTWLSGLVRYLPNVMVAAVIVFLGIMGGRLLRDLITTATGTAGLPRGNVLGMVAQYVVLLITILIAADQVGVDIAILTNVIDILLAAILFGAALAFGLGARTSVSNILASYYLQSRYREGHTIKIGEIEGQIIQITPTAVVLESTVGKITIPAKKFSEETSTLLTEEGVSR
ncbi:MAG: hypothetical protein DWQ10_03190 [Calditrichaeota bacterium]|nr:MAG: hypothetical protein DWQ10_03190 [Calditrichota bacterium]